MRKTRLAFAIVVGMLASSRVRADGDSPSPSVSRWAQWCEFRPMTSFEELNRELAREGRNGWELVAFTAARADNGGALVGFDLCYKQPLQAASPVAPAVSKPPPNEHDLQVALGQNHQMLTACRDAYATGKTEFSIQVTVAPSGQVREANVSGIGMAGNAPLVNCVERTVKLMSLPAFKGERTSVRTTFVLPPK